MTLAAGPDLGLPEFVEGPVESALADAIVESLGCTRPRIVAASKTTIGDFKVDVRPWAVSEDGDQRDCSTAADRLSRLTFIESAVAVPPHVYIRPSIDILESSVVAAGTRSPDYGRSTTGGGRVVEVQFSCPNLNKSLHLGHLRTNAIGMAIARVFDALGYRVITTDQPSNWGRHIAKLCVAFSRWCDAQTLLTGRADRVAGELYARCGPELDEDVTAFMARLEAGEDSALALNELLTEAAYDGIKRTYHRLDTSFDAVLREGDTLLRSRQIIQSQLGRSCQRRDDGSVYVDLSGVGLREVTLLRRDDTPLLHAYFLGASARRHELHPGAAFLFLMGREYAPTAPELREVVARLGFPTMADNTEAVFHGMVTQGTKKMSSREDAVDVEELLDGVAARLAADWRVLTGVPLDPFERDTVEQLAVALVKYHFLRLPRMKDMPWSYEDLWHRGSPRFAKVVRTLKAAGQDEPTRLEGKSAADFRRLLLALNGFPEAIRETAVRRDPSHLVRLIDDICDLACELERRGGLSKPLVSALAAFVRRCTQLLGVRLPAFPNAIPVGLFEMQQPDSAINSGQAKRGQPSPTNRDSGAKAPTSASCA